MVVFSLVMTQPAASRTPFGSPGQRTVNSVARVCPCNAERGGWTPIWLNWLQAFAVRVTLGHGRAVREMPSAYQRSFCGIAKNMPAGLSRWQDAGAECRLLPAYGQWATWRARRADLWAIWRAARWSLGGFALNEEPTTAAILVRIGSLGEIIEPSGKQPFTGSLSRLIQLVACPLEQAPQRPAK